jgi:hypothetical protein
MWEYVNGDPALGAETETEVSEEIRISDGGHPLPPLGWITNAALCKAVARLMLDYCPYDIRLSHKGQYYNIVTRALAAKYLVQETVPSTDERKGMLFIAYKIRDMGRGVDDHVWDWVNAACAGKGELISPIGALTDNVVTLHGATLTNNLIARRWCDVNDKNGNSLWQFREGDSTTDINQDTWSISVGSTKYYPTRSITLSSGDSAVMMDADGLKLGKIMLRGKPQNDIWYTTTATI